MPRRTTGARRCSSACRRSRRCGATRSRRACSTIISRATGFKSQQRPERGQPDRKDNLFEPVAGDHGAHGSFDAEAVDSSAELWITEHKKELGLAALGAAAVAGVGFHACVRNGTASRGRAEERTRAELSLACTRQPEPSHRPLLPVARGALRRGRRDGCCSAPGGQADRKLRAAQALGAGAAILCVSVALDSAIEHYRGEFKNRVMFVGPTIALLDSVTAA